MEVQSHLMIQRDSLVINVGAITRIKWFGALNVIGEGIVRTVFQHGEIKYHVIGFLLVCLILLLLLKKIRSLLDNMAHCFSGIRTSPYRKFRGFVLHAVVRVVAGCACEGIILLKYPSFPSCLTVSRFFPASCNFLWESIVFF